MIFISNEKDFLLKKFISVIYFYSSKVIFHKKMMIMLDLAEKQNKEKKFYAIDVDFFKNLTLLFKIKSLPTVIVTDCDGNELDRIVGISKTNIFLKNIKKHV